MSTTPLLPQAFWFRLSVPCRRVDDVPKPSGKRRLELSDDCLLPRTALLDGKKPWATVRVAWNPRGLAVEVVAEGSLDALGNDDRPEAQYGVQVWVDTRDTRDVSRATRFCHRFDARLVGGKGREPLGVTIQAKPIARAVADAPLAPPESLMANAEKLPKGWRVELFLTAAALSGFDPETNRRLGFAYHVSDPDREGQFLGVGREFPVGENPSLWSTLELRDPQ